MDSRVRSCVCNNVNLILERNWSQSIARTVECVLFTLHRHRHKRTKLANVFFLFRLPFSSPVFRSPVLRSQHLANYFSPCERIARTIVVFISVPSDAHTHVCRRRIDHRAVAYTKTIRICNFLATSFAISFDRLLCVDSRESSAFLITNICCAHLVATRRKLRFFRRRRKKIANKFMEKRALRCANIEIEEKERRGTNDLNIHLVFYNSMRSSIAFLLFESQLLAVKHEKKYKIEKKKLI